MLFTQSYRDKQILDIRKQGKSLRAIARELGVSHVTIIKRLKKLGNQVIAVSGNGNLKEPEIRPKDGWTDRDVAIWQLHQQGKKVKEISRTLGLREDWLHKQIAWLIRDVERDSSV